MIVVFDRILLLIICVSNTLRWKTLRVLHNPKKGITEVKTVHFNNYIKTAWKIVKNSTSQSQLYDSVTKINLKSGLITDTKERVNYQRVSFFNRLCIQIAENFNSKYISLHKSLQLLEKTDMN